MGDTLDEFDDMLAGLDDLDTAFGELDADAAPPGTLDAIDGMLAGLDATTPRAVYDNVPPNLPRRSATSSPIDDDYGAWPGGAPPDATAPIEAELELEAARDASDDDDSAPLTAMAAAPERLSAADADVPSEPRARQHTLTPASERAAAALDALLAADDADDAALALPSFEGGESLRSLPDDSLPSFAGGESLRSLPGDSARDGSLFGTAVLDNLLDDIDALDASPAAAPDAPAANDVPAAAPADAPVAAQAATPVAARSDAPSPSAPQSASPAPSSSPAAPVYSGAALLLTVNIEHISTTKKIKVQSDMPASAVLDLVKAQLAKKALVDGTSEYELFVGESKSAAPSDATLADLGLKSMDTVYMRVEGATHGATADSGGAALRDSAYAKKMPAVPPSRKSEAAASRKSEAAAAPTATAASRTSAVSDSSPSIVLTVNVPLAKTVKKIKFSTADTVADACGMVAAVLLRSRLLDERAKNTPFSFYRKANGHGKLSKTAWLSDVGLKAFDEVFMLDQRDPEQKLSKFDQELLPSRTASNGDALQRLDVLLPRAALESYKSAAQSAPGLLGGAELVGYMTKEGKTVKSWKRRLFVLHGQSLYYFVTDEDLEPKGRLDLTSSTTVQTEDGRKQKNCFSVNIDKRKLYVYTDEDYERTEWMEAIKKAAASGAPSPATRYESTHTLIDTLWRDATETVDETLERVVARVGSDFAYDLIDHPDDAAWGLFPIDSDDSPIGSDATLADGQVVQARPLEPSKLSAPSEKKGGLSRFLSRNSEKTSTASRSSGSKPVDKALTKAPGAYKGKTVLKEAVKGEEVKRVDTSVARSKPKRAAGRRGPTRRKKVEIALDRAERAPDADFLDLSGDVGGGSGASFDEPARKMPVGAVDPLGGGTPPALLPRSSAKGGSLAGPPVVSPRESAVSPRASNSSASAMARGRGAAAVALAGTMARGRGGRGRGAAPAGRGRGRGVAPAASAPSLTATTPVAEDAADADSGSGSSAAIIAVPTLPRSASQMANLNANKASPVPAPDVDVDGSGAARPPPAARSTPTPAARSAPTPAARGAPTPAARGAPAPVPRGRGRGGCGRGGTVARGRGRGAAAARGGRALPTPTPSVDKAAVDKEAADALEELDDLDFDSMLEGLDDEFS